MSQPSGTVLGYAEAFAVTAAMTRLSTRPISVSREGAHFRLSFSYDQSLIKKVRALPQAAWDPSTRTWTTVVCAQSVESLRGFHHAGLCDPAPDTLLEPDEDVPVLPDAVLRRGSRSRPYMIVPSFRDDQLFARLRALPGASWDKPAQGMALPPVAAAAVAELVVRGVVADPDGVLLTADVTVCFDVRSGEFTVFGDPRAQRSFAENFPRVDVVATWRERGIDVEFSDEFSAEVYAGELARNHGEFTSTQLRIPLHDYQSRAVAIARARTGLGVFAPPGLGKSAIGIGLAAECLADGEVPRVVIVCPGAVRTQWAEEITRFSGASDVAVVAGDAKARTKALQSAEVCRYLVVHYDVLDREFERLKPLCSGALIIADELHRAKNPTAKRTKALHRLGRLAHRRLGLTGTPVESNPEEWYWVHQFLTPGALGGLDDYRNRYMYQSKYGYEGSRNLPELRKRSLVHHVRFTKAQVAPHLPPLRVRHMPLDPDPAYASVLRRLHREARDEIAEDRVRRAGGALDKDAMAAAEMTAVSMLRDACISPRLLHLSDSDAAVTLCAAGSVPDVDGPKLDALRRICTELAADDERVVIFTYSERMAHLISERLDEDGVENVLFTGSTSHTDRDIARRRFNDPDDTVRASRPTPPRRG